MDSVFGASFLCDVRQLLGAMGYREQGMDEWLLGACCARVIERIKNACNVSEVPCGLRHTAVALAAGEFLAFKIGSGATYGFENLSFEPIVKQLQEGDTNIVYAVDSGSSDAARMLGFLDSLKAAAEAQFITYRRIRW